MRPDDHRAAVVAHGKRGRRSAIGAGPLVEAEEWLPALAGRVPARARRALRARRVVRRPGREDGAVAPDDERARGVVQAAVRVSRAAHRGLAAPGAAERAEALSSVSAGSAAVPGVGSVAALRARQRARVPGCVGAIARSSRRGVLIASGPAGPARAGFGAARARFSSRSRCAGAVDARAARRAIGVTGAAREAQALLGVSGRRADGARGSGRGALRGGTEAAAVRRARAGRRADAAQTLQPGAARRVGIALRKPVGLAPLVTRRDAGGWCESNDGSRHHDAQCPGPIHSSPPLSSSRPSTVCPA